MCYFSLCYVNNQVNELHTILEQSSAQMLPFSSRARFMKNNEKENKKIKQNEFEEDLEDKFKKHVLERL